MKLKEKIKNWLFKNEITELNDKFDRLQSNYNNAVSRLKDAECNYENAYKLVNKAQLLVNSIVDVGVDVGYRREDHSWAVICINGKPEYVKFIPLFGEDCQKVISFLKQFQYSNKVTDSPFGFKEMIYKKYFIK